MGCRYSIQMVEAEVKESTGIELPETNRDEIAIHDNQFVNKKSGKMVELYTVGGRRVAAQTGHRLRGVYILCDAGKTSKVVYP